MTPKPPITIPGAIVDQPPPVATTRRAAWDIVIEHTETRRKTGVLDLVLTDMRERDQTGRERYGVPLTSGNGRDHLVDAYQELLDGAAYFAAHLDEHGVSPGTLIDTMGNPAQKRLHCVQEMFWNHVSSILQLRAIIEEETKQKP
jgi:hypothetical protein